MLASTMDPSIFIFIFIVILTVVFLLTSRYLEKENFRECTERVKQLAEKHQKTLLIKRSQLIINDDYGTPDHSKWLKELTYFIHTIVLPDIEGDRRLSRMSDDAQDELSIIADIIDRYLIKLSETQKADPSYKSCENMTPVEYEHYCAALLREKGWDSKVTKASGDQGVDIIATRGRLKIAVQCKLYAKPVGNKAVQEIRTGVEFVEADYGVVVAPKGFTRSAKELASKTGVMLMHHSELQDIVQAL